MERIHDAVVSLFRVVVGLLFACHGAATLFGVLGGPRGGGAPPPIGAWPDWWAAVIELVAGGLVMVGLATRAAALLCSGTMAFAYFTVHQPKGLFPLINGGEPAALFCWSFLLLVLIGSGPWSFDTLVSRVRRKR
ncbi:DoxX family protein [Nonomuraea sp. NPDC050536]|uniref:DoxX family protein n=1 Tax=Nonomuraea sp. NPDC050536 TaxID=3364366 RepID=UPI0037CC4E10